MKILEHVDIKNYSTLRVGGQFRYFSIISSTEDLLEICTKVQKNASYHDVRMFPLGGGSNVVFSDGILNVLALKIEIKGFEVVKETNEYTDIKIGAGEVWDEIVNKTVGMNLSGLESLSAIPGTVGASPVQNIGAYGSEAKDTILEVEVFDLKEDTTSMISNKDCKFGYRDSIFKNEAKGKYVITSVTYRLKKLIPVIPDYPGVKKYFIENNINTPSLKQIREAIISIRGDKLPNTKEVPNVGSFFKNPIVFNEIAYKILENFPNAKFFPLKDDHTKIPAGWLIENSGLKGESFGNVSVYSKNALVLTNVGNATSEDVVKARDEIIKIVKDKFGIVLEQEPEIV